jgi:hypothetical protein
MRPLALTVILVALSAVPAVAGGYNANYLVPAFVTCPGPDVCGAPQRESSFTFETAILRAPRGKYLNPKKPALIVDIKGVRDITGALVTGDGFAIQLTTGQVNLVGLATTLPAGSQLSTQAPIPLPLTNGNGHLAYRSKQQAPSKTVIEGGGVTIYDSAGKRLATVGTQAK